MTQDSSMPVFRYRAFISYSHQDKAWADWLHKALETYAIPQPLIGQTTAAGVIPQRLAPIFRDRDELASATDLGRKVNEALVQSANLIVICSPRSATSHWVDEEVLAFKRLGRSERLFCLIVDGEPNACALPGREAEECFTNALRYALGPDGALCHQPIEPIAADARPGKDGKSNAKLKLIAGLLDLDYDKLKQRELKRHNRRLAAITALAVVVMAVTTTLAITALIARNAAVVAQQAAQRRQKQADDLVDFMLGDLNDKLAQVQRLDIMEAVDDKAMAYFQSLPSTDITDAALEQRAKALEKIGSVRLDQGHLAAALASFQAAAKLAGSLARAAPGDTTRQIVYSQVVAFIGMTDWYLGKLDAAQQDFESARGILQRAESHSATDPRLLFPLAEIDNNIGHVFEARGKLDEAETQYRLMLAHCRELVAGKAIKTEWTEHLGEAHNNLGKIALMRGNLAMAVAEYMADDAIESRLSEDDPKNNDQRENMARVRAILGRTLTLTGDSEAGLRDLQQAVDIVRQLTRVDPDHADFQERVAQYSMQLSRLRRLSGEPVMANALIAESLRIFAALTKQDPANAGWQREFAEARMEHAAQSLAAGKVDAARGEVQTALGILGPLLSSQPDERATLLATAGAKLQLAELTADKDVAQRLRNETLQAIQSVKSGRGDPRLLALQVVALLRDGSKAAATPVIEQLWESGYRDLALLVELQREHIDYPRNAAFQQRLQASIAENDRK